MPAERSDGIALERRVAVWAKAQFRGSESFLRRHATGLSVKRPYEIDVWVQVPGGWFRSGTEVWIECKDRTAAVTRRDISDLVSKARDVFQAFQAGKQEACFDTLVFVSTSRYDSDALALADQEGVGCILYGGGRYLLQNQWSSGDKPKWLKEVESSRR